MENMEPPKSKGKPMGTKIMNILPNTVRLHFVTMLGEFIGTFMFLFFAFASARIAISAKHAQAALYAQNTSTLNQKMAAALPDSSTLMYIALAFGFSLTVNAWVFFRISGGVSLPIAGYLLMPN